MFSLIPKTLILILLLLCRLFFDDQKKQQKKNEDLGPAKFISLVIDSENKLHKMLNRFSQKENDTMRLQEAYATTPCVCEKRTRGHSSTFLEES